MSVASKSKLKVADEIWIITALLHQEQPSKPDFSIEEILTRARQERLRTICVRGSMSTYYSIAWQTGLQIPAATAC